MRGRHSLSFLTAAYFGNRLFTAFHVAAHDHDMNA